MRTFFCLLLLHGVLMWSSVQVQATTEIEIETENKIYSSYVSATSSTELQPHHSKYFNGFLFEEVAKSLLASPFIQSIEISARGPVTQDKGYSYITHKRVSTVSLSIATPKPMRLLLNLEESYRNCEQSNSSSSSSHTTWSDDEYMEFSDDGLDYSSNTTSSCPSYSQKNSATITGPVVIYNNEATPMLLNLEKIIASNQVKINWTVNKKSNNKINITTKFTPSSTKNFPKVLYKVLNALQIPIYYKTYNQVSGSPQMSHTIKYMDQTNLYMSILRFLRHVNERTLK